MPKEGLKPSTSGLERAVRLELTNTGFAIRRLSRLATRGKLERKERFELSSRVWKTRMFPATSLPHFFLIRVTQNWSGRTELNCLHEFPGLGCSHYTTPRNLVRQVRLELTMPCLRGRCLDPIWLLTHGGTERTRTVIGLVDNQVPHL